MFNINNTDNNNNDLLPPLSPVEKETRSSQSADDAVGLLHEANLSVLNVTTLRPLVAAAELEQGLFFERMQMGASEREPGVSAENYMLCGCLCIYIYIYISVYIYIYIYIHILNYE